MDLIVDTKGTHQRTIASLPTSHTVCASGAVIGGDQTVRAWSVCSVGCARTVVPVTAREKRAVRVVRMSMFEEIEDRDRGE